MTGVATPVPILRGSPRLRPKELRFPADISSGAAPRPAPAPPPA